MPDKNRPKPTVPKFSTFKGKRGGRRDHKDDQQARHIPHKEARSKNNEHRQPTPTPTPHLPDIPMTASSNLSKLRDRDLFLIDLKGDIDNLRYGEINQHSVPLYYRPNDKLLIGRGATRAVDRNEKSVALNVQAESASIYRNNRILPIFDETRGSDSLATEDFMEIEDASDKAKQNEQLPSIVTFKG